MRSPAGPIGQSGGTMAIDIPGPKKCETCGGATSVGRTPEGEPVERVCAPCYARASGRELLVGDDRMTPEYILDAIRRIGPIAFDPCSNPWDSVGALEAWSIRDGRDGLAEPWPSTGLAFVNPPYGDGALATWTDKIVAEANDQRAIVALVPGDFSTRWFRRMFEASSIVCLVGRRVHFGGGGHGNPWPSAIFHLGPHDENAREVFFELGIVLDAVTVEP